MRALGCDRGHMPVTYQISTARDISHQNRTPRGSGGCRVPGILFCGFSSCCAICRILRPLQRSQEPGRAAPAVAYDHTARLQISSRTELRQIVAIDRETCRTSRRIYPPGSRPAETRTSRRPEFFVPALQAEVKWEILDEMGQQQTLVAEVATKLPTDLIAMVTHDRRGLARLVASHHQLAGIRG